MYTEALRKRLMILMLSVCEEKDTCEEEDTREEERIHVRKRLIILMLSLQMRDTFSQLPCLVFTKQGMCPSIFTTQSD